ncbi:MAG: ferritin family protein [Candidatus Njordarchaeia archaeon]
MLSKMPIDMDKVDEKNLDKEILRAAIIAELDAINLYEQLAAMTKNEKLKKILMDIAKEEKTHFGEFQALLLTIDPEQIEELKKGEEEVKELLEEMEK